MMSNEKKIFLVSKKSFWSEQLKNKLSSFKCEYFDDNSYINQLSQNPDWIFYFHWSEIVPKNVYENNKCVVLHTGNLPKGRGGSPIQNQILDGITETRVNAIVMGPELDAGDVYCSIPMTLQGTMTDIWLTLVDRAYELIKKCVLEEPTPKKQVGNVQVYKRNKNNVLPLENSSNLIEIHRFIQMLDAETYPSAYLKIGDFKLSFTRSKLNHDNVLCDVSIEKINENE